MHRHSGLPVPLGRQTGKQTGGRRKLHKHDPTKEKRYYLTAEDAGKDSRQSTVWSLESKGHAVVILYHFKS